MTEAAAPELEAVLVSEVRVQRDHGKLTVVGVPDHPGVMKRLFTGLGEKGVNVDMIVQNAGRQGTTDVTLTVPRSALPLARDALVAAFSDGGGCRVESDAAIAKLSLRGVGIRTHTGVAARAFAALAAAQINVEMISTSETEVSVVVRDTDAERGARELRVAFGLTAGQVS